MNASQWTEEHDSMFNRAMDSLFLVELENRQIDLSTGHRDNVKKMVKKYLDTYEGYTFKGLMMNCKAPMDLGITALPNAIAKASISLDLIPATITGRGTFNAVFPETSGSAIKLNANAGYYHYAYLMGIMEYSNANNIERVKLRDLNNDKMYSTIVSQVYRLSFLKYFKFDQGYEIPESGTFSIEVEFNNATDCELALMGVWIAPGQLIKNTNWVTDGTLTFVSVVTI